MEKWVMEMFARTLAIQAKIDVIKIEVEGMKVANAERESQGIAIAYNEHLFTGAAIKISSLADELNQIGG